jgi:glycosyltransferase involved in cell wall biosynthesis
MSQATPALSVVIPLYNEQDNIETLQRELHSALKGLDYEIVFVDDGSKDETVKRVEQRPEVRLLVFERCTRAFTRRAAR